MGKLKALNGGKYDSKLLSAAQKGAKSDVTAALKKGANKDCIDTTSGESGLHLATEFGHKDIVLILCAAGAKADLPSLLTRRTPLHIAVLRGRPQILKILLETHGNPLNLNLLDSSGETPLSLAISKRDLESLHHILSSGHKILSSVKPYLHLACENDFVEGVKALCEHGLDPNSQDSQQNTPLHLAAGYGAEACLDVLLEYGANSRATNLSGQTPLAIALLPDSENRNQSIINKLQKSQEKKKNAPTNAYDPKKRKSVMVLPNDMTPNNLQGLFLPAAGNAPISESEPNSELLGPKRSHSKTTLTRLIKNDDPKEKQKEKEEESKRRVTLSAGTSDNNPSLNNVQNTPPRASFAAFSGSENVSNNAGNFKIQSTVSSTIAPSCTKDDSNFRISESASMGQGESQQQEGGGVKRRARPRSFHAAVHSSLSGQQSTQPTPCFDPIAPPKRLPIQKPSPSPAPLPTLPPPPLTPPPPPPHSTTEIKFALSLAVVNQSFPSGFDPMPTASRAPPPLSLAAIGDSDPVPELLHLPPPPSSESPDSNISLHSLSLPIALAFQLS